MRKNVILTRYFESNKYKWLQNYLHLSSSPWSDLTEKKQSALKYMLSDVFT